MTYSVLPDIEQLKKTKLADLAALDGAISCIRVWKLGNIENRIIPTPVAINKLATMLTNNVGGGVMDLVWGPEIDLIETNTEAHNFLGDEKYAPCLTAIYAGLGIPPTLTGAANSTGGGFTNNFISLKTLTERLSYGRDILATFWAEEIRLVQKAMGFRFPATLVYDRMVLTDEAVEKKLLLDMWDRGLVSDESIIDRFGEVPDVEEARVRRDERKRASGQKPPKASPYHDPQQEFGLAKIFAQLGVVTPSEVGLELDERKTGEASPVETANEHALKLAKTTDANSGGATGPAKTKVGSPGRPKQAKDQGKRKQKQVNPRTSAAFADKLAWAERSLAKINSVSSPAYIHSLGKKTLRELTDKESESFESYKMFVLCGCEPGTEITQDTIAKLSSGKLEMPVQVSDLLQATLASHIETYGKPPTLDDLRRYQACAVALWHVADEVGDD